MESIVLDVLKNSGVGSIIIIAIFVLSKLDKKPVIFVTRSAMESGFKFSHQKTLEYYGELGFLRSKLMKLQSHFKPIVLVNSGIKGMHLADIILYKDVIPAGFEHKSYKCDIFADVSYVCP